MFFVVASDTWRGITTMFPHPQTISSLFVAVHKSTGILEDVLLSSGVSFNLLCVYSCRELGAEQVLVK